MLIIYYQIIFILNSSKSKILKEEIQESKRWFELVSQNIHEDVTQFWSIIN